MGLPTTFPPIPQEGRLVLNLDLEEETVSGELDGYGEMRICTDRECFGFASSLAMRLSGVLNLKDTTLTGKLYHSSPGRHRIALMLICKDGQYQTTEQRETECE